MPRNIVSVCVAVVSALLLPQSVSGVVAAPVDTCGLLTQTQASTALGVTLGAGKPLAGALCQWEQPGKPGDVLLKLNVDIVTAERFNRMKSVTLGTVTSLGGLGDEAFYATMKAGRTTLVTLNVRKGDTAVIIRVSGGMKPVEEYQAKEKAVAQVIVPKL